MTKKKIDKQFPYDVTMESACVDDPKGRSQIYTKIDFYPQSPNKAYTQSNKKKASKNSTTANKNQSEQKNQSQQQKTPTQLRMNDDEIPSNSPLLEYIRKYLDLDYSLSTHPDEPMPHYNIDLQKTSSTNNSISKSPQKTNSNTKSKPSKNHNSIDFDTIDRNTQTEIDSEVLSAEFDDYSSSELTRDELIDKLDSIIQKIKSKGHQKQKQNFTDNSKKKTPNSKKTFRNESESHFSISQNKPTLIIRTTDASTSTHDINDNQKMNNKNQKIDVAIQKDIVELKDQETYSIVIEQEEEIVEVKPIQNEIPDHINHNEEADDEQGNDDSSNDEENQQIQRNEKSKVNQSQDKGNQQQTTNQQSIKQSREENQNELNEKENKIVFNEEENINKNNEEENRNELNEEETINEFNKDENKNELNEEETKEESNDDEKADESNIENSLKEEENKEEIDNKSSHATEEEEIIEIDDNNQQQEKTNKTNQQNNRTEPQRMSTPNRSQHNSHPNQSINQQSQHPYPNQYPPNNRFYSPNPNWTRDNFNYSNQFYMNQIPPPMNYNVYNNSPPTNQYNANSYYYQKYSQMYSHQYPNSPPSEIQANYYGSPINGYRYQNPSSLSPTRTNYRGYNEQSSGSNYTFSMNTIYSTTSRTSDMKKVVKHPQRIEPPPLPKASESDVDAKIINNITQEEMDDVQHNIMDSESSVASINQMAKTSYNVNNNNNMKSFNATLQPRPQPPIVKPTSIIYGDDGMWMFMPLESEAHTEEEDENKKKQNKKEKVIPLTSNFSKIVSIIRSQGNLPKNAGMKISLELTPCKHEHFAFLLDSNNTIQGIYSFGIDALNIVKKWGEGPETIDNNNVKKYLQYNSKSKTFTDSENNSMNDSIIAISV